MEWGDGHMEGEGSPPRARGPFARRAAAVSRRNESRSGRPMHGRNGRLRMVADGSALGGGGGTALR